MKNQVLESLVVITMIEIGLYSSSDSGKGKGCFYNGNYHTDSWEEGCEYVCTCVNVETGHFRCSRRCTVYNDIPPGCVLERPHDEPCCMVPVCHNQTTTSSDNNKAAFSTTPPNITVQHTANDTVNSDVIHVTLYNNNATATGNVTPIDVTNANIYSEIQVSDFSSENKKDAITNRNPMIIRDANGHEIGQLMSMEELTPLDIASTNEIFIELPSIDDMVHFEKIENYSHSMLAENDNGNPLQEKASDLFHADQIPPPIHLLPNPLKDLATLDISRDVTQTPSENYDIPSSSKTPLNASWSNSERVISNSLRNISNETEYIVVHNSSFNGIPFVNSSERGPNADASISENTSDKLNTDGVRVQTVEGRLNESFGERNNVNETSNRNDPTHHKNARYSDVKMASVPKPMAGDSSTENAHTDKYNLNDNNTSLSFVQEYNVSDVNTGSTTSNRPNYYTYGNGISNRQTDQVQTSTQKILSQTSQHFDGGTSDSVTRPIVQVPKIRIEDIAVKRGRCVFMGMQFRFGQTWFDGCNQLCICLDAKTGFFNCTKRCPKYRNIPQGCVLKVISPGCCPKPDCAKPSNILRNTMLPTALQSMMASNRGQQRTTNVKSSSFHTAAGTFLLNDVIGSTGSKIGRLVPAAIRNSNVTRNATDGNTGPLKSPLQTLLGFCQYNGRRYRPGDLWQIGCDLVCRCLPGLHGQYACRKRCKEYPVVPYGCSLHRLPGDPCCKTLLCPNTSRPVVPSITSTSRRKSFGSQGQRADDKGVSLRGSDGKRPTHPLAKLLKTKVASKSISADMNSSALTLSINLRSTSSSPSNITAEHGNTKSQSPETLDTRFVRSRVVLPSGRQMFPKQLATGKSGLIEIIATTGCVIGNKVYRRGQSWKIGCRFRCFCSDEIKQTMTCTQLCPKWKLPAACKLEQPPEGKCCTVPKCAPGYRINYPDGYIPL